MQRYYDVDPIVNELYVDNNGNKYSVLVTNEEHRVVDSRVILNGLPDPGYRVVVESNGNILTEVSLNEKLSDNTKYKVDYASGFVNLHSNLEGQMVNVKQYHSRGLTYFPASRVYTELDEWGKVKETVSDIEGSIAQVIEITETLPDKLDQVIEAGQIIDSEMANIEEFGRQFNELKQMSEEATTQANIIMDFMSQIDGATDELQLQILRSQEQYDLLQSSKADTDALFDRLELLDGQIQDLINNSNTTRTELANSILAFNNEVGDIVDRLNTLEGDLSGYEANINALITEANAARQMLQDTIDGSDLSGYATQVELNTKEDKSNKGVANGYAPLDASRQVPLEFLPPIDTFPSGGSNGQVLKFNNGNVVWGTDNNTVYTHPSTHPATMITESVTKRFVTDNEKATWNNKQDTISELGSYNVTYTDTDSTQKTSILSTLINTIRTSINNKVDKETGKGLSSNDYTTTEKNKLSGIQAGAEKNVVTSVNGQTGSITLDLGTDYTHPTSHPASMIVEDATHRFVTDTEKTTWNNKQNTLTAGTNVSISGNTISATNTTYSVATTSANGLMSSTDKRNLNNVQVTGIKVITSGSFTTSTLPSGWLGFRVI